MNKRTAWLIIFFSFCLITRIAEAGWYNAAWSRRKPIIITGSSAGTQTNYQLKITASYDSDMQADFDDIRFTDSDGTTLLDHWLEIKTDSSSAIFWVEAPSIPASPSTLTIYMYYGNSTVSTASNGVNTFDWFDDFADSSISASYTKINYDGWSEANGVLTFTSGGTTALDPNVLKIDNKTYGYGYEIRGKIQIRQWQDQDYSRTGFGLRTNTAAQGYKGLFHWSTNKTRAVLHDLVAWLSQSNLAWSLNTWYQMAFFASLSGSTRSLYEKDWATGAAEPSSYTISTTSTNATYQDGQPCIAGSSIPAGGFTTQFIGDYDDVFVRKCVSPEPSVGTAGSEESAAAESTVIGGGVLGGGAIN